MLPAGLDRVAAAAARRLLQLQAGRLDPSERVWLEALGAELEVIDSGLAQLGWALGGFRLVWSIRVRGLPARIWRTNRWRLARGGLGFLLVVTLLVSVLPNPF
jgi:hypothetical protein